MRQRRRFALPLLTACAVATASACGPNDQAQTVSFVLATSAERLTYVEFLVGYSSGKFAGTDGQCVVSSAAGPRSVAIAEARMLEKDRVRSMSRKDKRAHAAEVRAITATTATTATTQTTNTDAPTTTLLPTTTLASNGDCGNGQRDNGEQCDDGNVASGDGCDGNCNAEFAFSSTDDDEGQLTIKVTNGLGIPPGAALAFCKFQGDVAAADFRIRTTSCTRANNAACNPTTNGLVTVSTTTTTTTTTTSTTSTTTNPDGTSTTSTTL